MLRFGRFELDYDNRRLMSAGHEVPLEQRAFDLLWYLATHPRKLIRKDELLEQVWNAHVLSDGVLSNTVAKLRKALGQDSREREPIETLYGRGYRFHADVEALAEPFTATQVSQPSAASAALGSDPFVGRSAVLELLEDRLDRAKAGHGQLLLIAGDAGIGKSRTLAELVTRAKALGFSAWQGSAYAEGAVPAYWPWVEVLRGAHAELGSGWQSHVPDDAWALARWVPELIAAPPREVDGQELRFRAFDELARFLASACREAPRLIVLEDLQFTDAATIELLAHVARALASVPVVFAASLREPELARDDASARALRRCLRHASHVALVGLSEPEVAELVAGLGAVAADRGFVENLRARTQGNPFFVRQLVSLFQQTGKALESSQLLAAELPPAVRGVIRERLIDLEPETRALLCAASVIGEFFDLAVLRELRQCTTERVLAQLEPALALSLVRAHDRTPHRFSFRHVLLRDVLYDELGLIERGQLHARMRRLLAGQNPDRESQQRADIARHSLLALPSELEPCVRDCLLAAEAAHHASGFEAASEILQRALEKVDAEGGSIELRCQLLLPLGMSQMCAGDIGAALGTHERGARLARGLDSPELLARFVGRLGDWLDMGGERTDVAVLLEDALERVRHAAAAPRATLLAQHAAIGDALAPLDRARLFDEAEELARESGQPEVVLEVAMARVNRRDVFRREESRRAIAAYQSLAQSNRESSSRGQYQLRRFSAALTEYLCALTEGELVRIQLAATQCESIASESHVLPLHQASEVLRAGRALAEGRLDDLEAAVDKLREGSSLPGGLGLVWIWYALQLSAARGESIEQLMAQSDLSVLQRVAPRQRNAALVGAARVIARAGHHALAQELVNVLALRREDLERLPNLYGDLGYLCSIVELRWELRDLSDVSLLEKLLLPHAGLNAVGVAFDYNGSVAHYLGMLSLMQGRSEEAIQRLQMAYAYNEQLNMPLQLARTRSVLKQAMS